MMDSYWKRTEKIICGTNATDFNLCVAQRRGDLFKVKCCSVSVKCSSVKEELGQDGVSSVRAGKVGLSSVRLGRSSLEWG